MTPAGARTRARRFALQVLYALDLNPDATVDEALSACARDFDVELDDATESFGAALVREAVGSLAGIDDIITGASRNWRLDRMSRVDRNILRLATCELKRSDDVPVKVVINEAVELAKRYGATESPAFVNGILDRIAQHLRP